MPSKSSVLTLLLLSSAFVGAGCEGSRDPVACDPLASYENPTKLYTVLAAGKHTDGTVYVIDDAGKDQLRLFVSQSGVLVRQRVGGSGRSANFISVTLTNPQLVVTAELSNEKVQRMAVVRGAITGKSINFDLEGDLLTTVGDDDAKKMSVRNLPGTILLEHFGVSADGQNIVATRPQDDWTYEDFKVYMGRPPALLERKVRSVRRGSYTDVYFDVDGIEAKAHFPSSLGGGDPFVKVGDNMMAMTVPPAPNLDGISFRCIP
jgi:hypothetical protein